MTLMLTRTDTVASLSKYREPNPELIMIGCGMWCAHFDYQIHSLYNKEEENVNSKLSSSYFGCESLKFLYLSAGKNNKNFFHDQ